MGPIQELSNDNLVTLATATMVNGKIYEAANEELLRRLANKVTSEANDAMNERVQYQIKDLHERYDQVCKRLVELVEDGKPSHHTPPEGYKNKWSYNDLESLVRYYMKWRTERPGDLEGPSFPKFIICEWIKNSQ